VDLKQFIELLRLRLSQIGVVGVGMYGDHSLKRGCVQLYSSLGLSDEMIMQIVQMTGHHAYANYCAAYNDCAPLELPRFTPIKDYITHAERISGECDLIQDSETFDEWILEMGRDDLADASGA